eukprot:6386386-Pyramimonas_sp.AAC.1
MSLVEPQRIIDIWQTLGANLVVLPGTQLRASSGALVSIMYLGRAMAFHAGWDKGPCTNKRAGCTIMIGGFFSCLLYTSPSPRDRSLS